MRLALVIFAMLSPAPLLAQDAPAGEAATVEAEAPKTCAELRAEARAEHDRAEAARIAENDDGTRRVFFFACPEGSSDPAPVDAAPIPTRPSEALGFGGFDLTRIDTPAKPTTIAREDENSRYRYTIEGDPAGYARETESSQQCTETAFQRSCTSSFSTTSGTSPEARAAVKNALDGLLSDD